MRMFLDRACALLDLTERPGKYKRRETWSPYLVPDRTPVNELRWGRHSCLLRVEVLLRTSSLRARFRRRVRRRKADRNVRPTKIQPMPAMADMKAFRRRRP